MRTHICLRAEKRTYCKGPDDILIDDLERNIAEWQEAGGTGILFNNGPQSMPQWLQAKLKLVEEE